jgi:hypothetical protein
VNIGGVNIISVEVSSDLLNAFMERPLRLGWGDMPSPPLFQRSALEEVSCV